MTLNIQNVTKTFNAFTAVNDVSFRAEPGRIFGFLGTNGAGKSTTMRMVLDIIRSDTGTITWGGTPTMNLPRNMFGYLPEERGLYPKMVVQDQLMFLGQLYGASAKDIDARITEWLERLNITENWNKTVDQLSKGNQQKIQFLASLLHDPEILILDEPFSGLDPVNAEQMKQSFREMRDRGKTIIFSTHQLDDAQELSSDVAIIHRGTLLTSGTVEQVRQSVGEHYVRLSIAGDSRVAWLEDMPHVHVVRRRQDYVELAVPDEAYARRILAEAMRREQPVTRFEIDYPSLNDVFLTLVQRMPADMQPTDEEMAVPEAATA